MKVIFRWALQLAGFLMTWTYPVLMFALYWPNVRKGDLSGIFIYCLMTALLTLSMSNKAFRFRTELKKNRPLVCHECGGVGPGRNYVSMFSGGASFCSAACVAQFLGQVSTIAISISTAPDDGTPPRPATSKVTKKEVKQAVNDLKAILKER